MGARRKKSRKKCIDRHDRENFFCVICFSLPYPIQTMHKIVSLYSCTVDGLPLNEFRVLAEKSAAAPEHRDEKNRRVEFATPTFNVLNALEQMGYRVVTSGAFVTGHNKFDQREFVWTLHRSTSEMECQ